MMTISFNTTPLDVRVVLERFPLTGTARVRIEINGETYAENYVLLTDLEALAQARTVDLTLIMETPRDEHTQAGSQQP